MQQLGVSGLNVPSVGGCEQSQTTMEFWLDALLVGVPFGVHAVHLRDDLRDELWFRVGAPNPHRDVVPIGVVQRLRIGRCGGHEMTRTPTVASAA